MGKRKRNRQSSMWVATMEFPMAAGYPFYTRLNQQLREHGFDGFAEGQCARFYAHIVGQPGLPPGIYFRLLLIGYFEGIDSDRGIASRAADSFALRDASVDRSRDASRRLYLGAATPQHGRLGEGQDDWNRRHHA